jgi:hypothetical protein
MPTALFGGPLLDPILNLPIHNRLQVPYAEGYDIKRP